MEKLTKIEREEVKTKIRKVISKIYGEDTKYGVFVSFRKLPITTWIKDEGLAIAYGKMLIRVLTDSKNEIGTPLLEVWGNKGGTQYKVNKCYIDSDSIAEKVLRKLKVKQIEPGYPASSKEDLTPMYKNYGDPNKKIYKSKGTIKSRSLTQVLGVGSKCYIIVDDKIHSGMITGVFLDINEETKTLYYQVIYRESDEDIRGLRALPSIELSSKLVFIDVESALQYLKSSIIKF